METVFRNESKYITFWAIWGTCAVLLVRWMITDPIVQALEKSKEVRR